MKLRRAVLADAAALAAVEQTQPRAAGWAEHGFCAELKLPFAVIFCAEEDINLVGFIALRSAAGVAEILNLAVRSDYTGRAIGRTLMEKALSELKQSGAEQVSLEVAKDNLPACGLYEKAGFIRCGERKNFYGPGQDAWILVKKL